MANLGNTIINGALRVNGKINASDVISAPSFVGAGETLTGHLYLNGITSSTTASTTKIIFGNPTTQYAVIRANDSKTLVFANDLTDNSLAIEYIPSETAFRPITSASLDLGSNNNKWKNVYANTFVGALSGNASSATNATNTAITNTNPTTGTWYYPTWVTGTSGNLPERTNDGLRYYSLQGTTSALGHSYVQIGNATAAGTAGNKQGHLRIYSGSSGYVDLDVSSTTSNFVITLPAASGTVSLNGHTHNYLPLGGGTLTNDLSEKVNSIDATLANNNVSSTIYPTTFNILDKNNRILNRLECIAASNGSISSYLYVRNYKTDGSMVAQKGIKLTMAKNGTLTYDVADANNFRSAISAVNKAGDILTGNLSYNMNGATQIPFKVYGGDANGQGVSVGAGGATIVGSGESAKACESLLAATTETLWLASDNDMAFITNCQTIGNRVSVNLSTSREFYPNVNNTGTLGKSDYKWNNVYATTFTGNLSGNAATATKLATARTIGVSGVTGTAQSFNGTANIVIPITAVPSTLLTNRSAIKGSEITNDKHWVPSSDASVTNFVSMTAEEYATNASSLATGTIVAITDGVEGYVTTQATSLTCDLPLDL